MKAPISNINLMAMAAPKTREECLALAAEALAELKIISQHISAAIARCEEQEVATATA